MEHELLSALHEDFVKFLHVKLGAECHRGEGLCLTPGEDCRTVCAREIAHFTPYRADLGGAASVETDALVQYHVSHGRLFHCMVVSFDHHLLFIPFLFWESLVEFFLEGVEGV